MFSKFDLNETIKSFLESFKMLSPTIGSKMEVIQNIKFHMYYINHEDIDIYNSTKMEKFEVCLDIKCQISKYRTNRISTMLHGARKLKRKTILGTKYLRFSY